MSTVRDWRILPASLCALSLFTGCSTSVDESQNSSETHASTGQSESDSSASSSATTTPEPTTGTSTGNPTTAGSSDTTDTTENPSTTDSDTESDLTSEGETIEQPGCEDAVAFPDPKLGQALRAQLMLEDEEEICASALAQLPTALDLSGWEISDLTGLTYLAHITDLDLHDNQISDVSPVAALVDLNRLDLSQNPVSDLSVLAVMGELDEVSINNTEVSTLLDLAQAQVKVIRAQHTPIVDLTPIAAAEGLTVLDLEGSQVTDLSPLLDAVWLNVNECVELRFNACELDVVSLESVLLQVCAAGHEMHWDGGVGSCNVEMCA